MLLLIPPKRRTSHPEDEAGPDRIRRLMVRGLTAAGTIVATAWCCTFGWLPAIVALVVAKHVLVAILLMDLGVDDARR